MIGAIHFAEGLTASLDDSGRWECAHQGIEQQLNALFRPGDGPGLIAVLPPGEAVARAARFYGAHAELPEDQQRQSEVVLFGEEGEMSPLPYRGQRIKSLSGYDVKAAKRNVRGQDCPPGYNPERDGCRKVAKKPKQPKSQSVYSDRGKKPESGGARVMTPEEIKTVLRRRGEVDVADAIDKMSRSDSTYDATDWQYRNGLLSQSEWEAYNYLFANTTDRFSGIAASYDLRGDATNQDSTIPEGYSIREMPEEMRRRYGGNKLGLFREGQTEPVNSMVDDTEEAILEMVSKLQGPDGTTGFAVLDGAKKRRKPVSEDDRQRKKRERELKGPAWARRGPGAMFGRKPTPPKVPESPAEDKWPDQWPEGSGEHYWNDIGAMAALDHPVAKRKPKSKAEGDAMLPYIGITDKAKASILKAKNQNEADAILAEMNRELDALNDAVDAVASREAKAKPSVEEMRDRIVSALDGYALTIQQVADRAGIQPAAAQYIMSRLQSSGFVKVSKDRTTGTVKNPHHLRHVITRILLDMGLKYADEM